MKKISSTKEIFGKCSVLLLDNWPFLIRNWILVNVYVIAISVHVMVEYQGDIHEGTGTDKTALFLYFHFLNVKHKNSIEYLKCNCTLSSKYHDFLVSDLIGQTHIWWDPPWFVYLGSRDFLPLVSVNIVDLNNVYYVSLINPSSKCKQVLILETT